MGAQKKFAACAAVAVAAIPMFAAVEPDNAGGESKGSRRYDKENLLWQSSPTLLLRA